MAKATSREIGRRATRVFQEVCPSNWVTRSQEDQEDYGIDFELEVTQGDKPVGALFKAQVKGTEDLQRNPQGPVLHGLPVERLTYQHRLPLPVVYVLVDTLQPRVYWTLLQGNREFETALRQARESGQDTMTVQFSDDRVLPEAVVRVLEAVGKGYEDIALRAAAALSEASVARLLRDDDDIDSTAMALRSKAEVARCEQIERMIRREEYVEAQGAAESMLTSNETSTRGRVQGAEFLIRSNMLATGTRGDHSAHRRLYLRTANLLIQIVRADADAGPFLRAYARLLARIARLQVLVEADWGLFLSAKSHAEFGDAAAKAVVAIARNATIARLNRALHRLHTAVASVTARGEVTAVSLLFPSMCRAILPAQIRLRDASTVDTRKSILAWFDSVRTLAVEAALRGHMWSHAALCASTFMTLADPDDADDVGRRAEQARAVAARILDDRVRADLEDDLDRAVATFAAAPPDGPSIEDEAHMYREIIAGYGIDLADPKDPRAALARQGLLDLNPERALRHCVHAYIACGPLNAVASQLQMPSAAVKRLVCTLHGYEVENLVLDDAAREFKERFCTKCPDRSPHSEAWRWTRAWQARQDSPPKS
ncbi:MAG: DUF4365 domain-containing protein [Planctomycetes bacterium]|nr:DUF4365 domain-containing protein [Planctomycetota bacterium]MCB9828947.1 DUF4365 domain-containing protein [Planctomycetota bacterium]MCB9901803.1 DUF4365 domain-containing protein [Planctomycetota bacterium]